MSRVETIKIDKFRTRKILSIFPFIIANGFTSDFHWTGKWFKYIDIIEQRGKFRYTEFDEYSCEVFWSKWKYNWYIIKS